MVSTSDDGAGPPSDEGRTKYNATVEDTSNNILGRTSPNTEPSKQATCTQKKQKKRTKKLTKATRKRTNKAMHQFCHQLISLIICYLNLSGEQRFKSIQPC